MPVVGTTTMVCASVNASQEQTDITLYVPDAENAATNLVSCVVRVDEEGLGGLPTFTPGAEYSVVWSLEPTAASAVSIDEPSS